MSTITATVQDTTQPHTQSNEISPASSGLSHWINVCKGYLDKLYPISKNNSNLIFNDNPSSATHPHETVDDIDGYIKEELYKLSQNHDPSVEDLDHKFRDFGGHDRNPLTSLISLVKSSVFPPPLSELLQERLNDAHVPVWDTMDEEIVIVGGYKGSILKERSTGKKLWMSLKAGFNLADVDLTIGPNPEDEIQAQKDVIAEDMMCEVGPVDISMKLKRKLMESGKCKVHTFGYDWRLSQHINSTRLHEFLSKLDCNQPGSHRKGAIVIAHSMGGLISHHAMQKAPELFKGLVYAGVPSETANILGPFKYGDPVLFNNNIITPESSFFMRSGFVFLPEDGRCFVDANTGREYNLNFFDPEVWTKYNLCPLVSQDRLDYEQRIKETPLSSSLPPLAHAKEERTYQYRTSFADCKKYLTRTLQETQQFHSELKHDPTKNYPPLVMLYGDTVPTGRGSFVSSHQAIIDGEWEDLDNTKPIFGAGDGTVYHKFLMPERKEGFKVAKKVRSERNHMGLLTDLDGVSRCLEGIIQWYEENER
ncbi:hypothetical protein WICPIJ_008252 [Wickerhamomyces pijperi]|uniref:Uncharacterized protein n=1 Tax=Wickerhamomyces pijperi TaxID=599730 RepID=A0A9P8TJ31_WICPI|nr:hypothetical protein WICPIJ_008252 [Wickerhamomyces pijperi]